MTIPSRFPRIVLNVDMGRSDANVLSVFRRSCSSPGRLRCWRICRERICRRSCSSPRVGTSSEGSSHGLSDEPEGSERDRSCSSYTRETASFMNDDRVKRVSVSSHLVRPRSLALLKTIAGVSLGLSEQTARTADMPSVRTQDVHSSVLRLAAYL